MDSVGVRPKVQNSIFGRTERAMLIVGTLTESFSFASIELIQFQCERSWTRTKVDFKEIVTTFSCLL